MQYFLYLVLLAIAIHFILVTSSKQTYKNIAKNIWQKANQDTPDFILQDGNILALQHYYIANAGLYICRHLSPAGAAIHTFLISMGIFACIIIAVIAFVWEYYTIIVVALIEAAILMFSSTAPFFSFTNRTYEQFITQAMVNYRSAYPKDEYWDIKYNDTIKARLDNLPSIEKLHELAEHLTQEHFAKNTNRDAAI